MPNLREATMGDMAMMFDWCNDPGMRKHSHNSSPVPWLDHEKWYVTKMDENPKRVWIACEDDHAIGYGRADAKVNYRALVSVGLDEVWRGLGVGTWLIRQVTDRLVAQGLTPVAHIYPANSASIHAFVAAGYVHHGLIGDKYHEYSYASDDARVLG